MKLVLHVEDVFETQHVPSRIVRPVRTSDGIELVETRVCLPNRMRVLRDDKTT